MADLLIDWFGFSCFAYVKLTTYLLVWSNSDQSNRRSTLQWYFILFSYLPNHWLSNGAAEIPSNSLLQMHLLSQLLPMVWSPMTAKVVLSNKERDRTESKIKVKRPKSSRQWESNVGHRWRVRVVTGLFLWRKSLCQRNLLKWADSGLVFVFIYLLRHLYKNVGWLTRDSNSDR